MYNRCVYRSSFISKTFYANFYSMTFKGVFLLFFIFFVGCSYRFGTHQRQLPGGHKTVKIPLFKNQTHFSGIEPYFTKALINEVSRSQLAQIENEGSAAQVTFEGEIKDIRFVQGAKFDPNNPSESHLLENTELTKEYRIYVKVEIKVRRNSDGQILWARNLDGERLYDAPLITRPIINSASATYNHSARHIHINLLAKDMMNKAYSLLTENF